MNGTAKQLEEIVEAFYLRYKDVNDAIASNKLSHDKWTLKEIMGHLIDSASNNHQRFVRMQIKDKLDFPDYDNEVWLGIGSYNTMPFSDLLNLFRYYNRLIGHIIRHIHEKSLSNTWRIPIDGVPKNITLEGLVRHYLEHIEGHIAHFRQRLEEVRR
jgi:hypothetical protein